MLAMQPSMKHVLEVVFALSPDSPVHRAMECNMYTISEDFIMETDETINDLIFKGNDKKNVKIPKAGGASLLKTFKQFVAHQVLQGIPFGPSDWLTITRDEFNIF